MRVVISNFGTPISRVEDADYLKTAPRPSCEQRLPLFDYRVGWGFHLYALGIYIREKGIADEVEYWNFSEEDHMPWQQDSPS